jgi:Domain of Unknown Function (DUF1080)
VGSLHLVKLFPMKFALIVCTIFVVVTLSFSFNTKDGWVSLLDKNLTQWNNYLSYRHSETYSGEMPKNEKVEPLEPVGLNKDTDSVFSVLNENGGPVLRVSGEIYGCLFTKEEFSNYHLRLKVKWGTKKWPPRKQKLRDSGICYHSIGDYGKDYWRAWMMSQEFQIMEGHMGDYWNIGNSAIDIKAFLPEGTMNPVAGNDQPFLAMGTGTDTKGFCLRTVNNESPNGQWTTLDLICYNGNSLHIVNGKVVMVLSNSRYHQDNKDILLTKGKIQIQSEGAEVFYKDIEIKKLNTLPQEYANYFVR